MPRFTSSLLGLTLAYMSLHAQASSSAASPKAPGTLSNASGESVQWSGIGRLSMIPGKQCIATLIDSRGAQPSAAGPAYVLTSGHCVDKRNGVIIHDAPAQGSVAFNYFIDTAQQRKSFGITRRVWSSMQGTDLALLELDSSLDDVMAQGIVPLRLAPSPEPGSEVQVIGEPSVADEGLRVSTCTEQLAEVVVQQPWVWRKARRNDCHGIAEGSSGSPVVTPDDHRIVSVLNSIGATPQGVEPCKPDNPCHWSDAASVVDRPLNYAMPVHRLMGCFRDGRADLSLQGCDLLPGFQWRPREQMRHIAKIITDTQGQAVAPTWDLAFDIDTPRYRHKTVDDPLECEEPDGYSGTVIAQENYIDSIIGTEPGWRFLCLIGVQDPDQKPSPALMANSLSLAVEVLAAAPVPEPDMAVARQDNGDIRVAWALDPPNLVHYKVKKGAVASTDCDDPSGFRLLRHQAYTFKAAQLPLKLCTRGEDIIGQHSIVRTDLLTATD